MLSLSGFTTCVFDRTRKLRVRNELNLNDKNIIENDKSDIENDKNIIVDDKSNIDVQNGLLIWNEILIKKQTIILGRREC